MIAASSANGAAIGSILVATVVTVVVFWLAHVYASVVASGPGVSTVGAAMLDELLVIEAPFASVLVLLAGLLGAFDAGAAVQAALWLAVAQLVAWGAAVARRLGRSWPAAAAFGVVSGMFGVVIILFKALVH